MRNRLLASQPSQKATQEVVQWSAGGSSVQLVTEVTPEKRRLGLLKVGGGGV